MPMIEKEASDHLKALRKDLTTYVETRIELLKLSLYEQTGRVVAILSHGAIMLLLGFFAILFLFLVLSFYLGELLHSAGTGFAIVTVLYILLILLVNHNKRWIYERILNAVVRALLSNDDLNNKKRQDEQATTTDSNRTTTA